MVAGEIGGDVGEHALGNELVVPTEEDFSHDICVIPKILDGAFGSQIIEAVSLWHQLAIFRFV